MPSGAKRCSTDFQLARLYELYESSTGKNGSSLPDPTDAGGRHHNETHSDKWEHSKTKTKTKTKTHMPSHTAKCNGTAAGGSVGGPGSGVAPPDGKCVNTTGNSTEPVTPNSDKILYHRALAANYSAAIQDLHWDPVKAYWYDFNMTSMTRSDVFTPAGLWPLWQNVTPPALLMNETLALSVASGIRFLLGHYAGSPSVASVLDTGLNWDFPNVWPPHACESAQCKPQLILQTQPSGQWRRSAG